MKSFSSVIIGRRSLFTWSADTYLRYSSQRLRPALDLMSAIRLGNGGNKIIDLGCGAGNVTEIICNVWPNAVVTGLDGSDDMLKKAAKNCTKARFVQGDIENWDPGNAKYDIIFSNAALHWLNNHATLFPRLVSCLNPGGVLAIQMPRNHQQPSHTMVAEAAKAGPWSKTALPLIRPNPVATPEEYYRILAPHCDNVEVWETRYMHALTGDNPVVQWTMGTTLRPVLDALQDGDRQGFLQAYSALIAKAYPKDPSGVTLFPFQRVFMVATAKK